MKHGLEGIVAKRKDSRYLPRKRSRYWLKFKHRHSTICYIVGYERRPSKTSDILITQVERGQWIYRGRIEFGFGPALEVKLHELELPGAPAVFASFRSRKIRWLTPSQCEITYQEITPTGLFRIPVLRRFLKSEAQTISE